MYCSRCGQAIGSQPQCPNCGAPTGVGSVLPVFVSRVAKHIHMLGILWVVFALYSVVRWVLILPFLRTFMDGRGWIFGPNFSYMPFHYGAGLLGFISAMVLGRALLALGVGIALLTLQPWARILAVVAAILVLLKPLLGMLLAIYTLWVLLGRNADRDYALLAGSRLPYQQ